MTLSTTSALMIGAAPAGGGFIAQMIPLLLIFVIFWFLLIRPQQKRMKEHQATINAVQKNDKVVTGGGIVGKVTKVGDDEVEIEIAQGVRIKAIKNTLSGVIDPKTAKPAND